MEIFKKVYEDRVEWRDEKDLLSRIDGPAIEWLNGDQEWYKNGKRHRIDGPAIIIGIYKKWCLNGIDFRNEDEWFASLTIKQKIHYSYKIKSYQQVFDDFYNWKTSNGLYHKIDGPAVEWKDGRYEWFLMGVRHRVGGPALRLDDGTLYWFYFGEKHRVDGPAVESAYGRKEWYQNNKRHRVDGPAVEGVGYIEWWLNNKKYKNCEEWFEDLSEKDKLNYLFGFKSGKL